MPTAGTTTTYKTIRVPVRRLSATASQNLVKTRERQTQALELKKAGATLQQIADSLGYANPSSAKKAVDAATRRLGVEVSADTFRLDLERLDEYTMRCTDALRKGDLNQIDRLLRIMQQRWALLNLASGGNLTPRGEGGGGTPGGTTINGGVMVIQGTESEFVKGMMQAIGIDENDPHAMRTLKEIEKREAKQRKEIEKTPTPPLPGEDESLIVDAEIVEAEEVPISFDD